MFLISALPFGKEIAFSEEVHVDAGFHFDFGATEFRQQHMIADFDAARDDFALVSDGAGSDGNHCRVVHLFVRFWQDDSALGFCLSCDPLDEDAVGEGKETFQSGGHFVTISVSQSVVSN